MFRPWKQPAYWLTGVVLCSTPCRKVFGFAFNRAPAIRIPDVRSPFFPARPFPTQIHPANNRVRLFAASPKFIKQQSLVVHGPDDTSKRPFKLVIVESPSKCSTISKILEQYVKDNQLDHDFVVTSCMGHIRDLPKKKTSKEQIMPGIDLEGGKYEPSYEIMANKALLLEDLKDWTLKSQQLILATDDDREGEAMAWHLLECLQKKKSKLPPLRVRFTEITAKAIRAAIETSSTSLRDSLVQAQETRRILDRLAGFTVSPILWKKIAPGLSAGRVQSVGMALVVRRERQRLRFKESEYWDLNGTFSAESLSDDSVFAGNLISMNGKTIVSGGNDFDPSESNKLTGAGLKKMLMDGPNAMTVSESVAKSPDKWSWTIDEVKSTRRQFQAPNPFITSTLQQESNKRLSLSVSQTMQTAQRLYEQGYISYMRTDSNHLSEDAMNAIRECIVGEYGGVENFQPKAPKKQKKSKKSKAAVDPQAAHEAIRPSIQSNGDFLTPSSLPPKMGSAERSLYEMIFQRTVACCMPPQISNQTSVLIGGNDGDTSLQFRVSGSVVVDPGYTRVYPHATEKEVMALPVVSEGQKLMCQEVTPRQHMTQPPARYTEASFVKELEELGVGRPSTYASVVQTLRDRAYVGSPISAKQEAARGKSKEVSGGAISAKRAAGGDEFTGFGNARGPLVPSLSAFVVCSLLEEHCPMYVDSDFTARMEEHLDRIANTDVAEAERIKYLHDFYGGDEGLAAQIATIDREVSADDARRARLPILDVDSSDSVGLFIGPWGPYVQKVNTSPNATGAEKPVSAGLPPGMAADLSTITPKTLEMILRSKEENGAVLGEHPDDGRLVRLKVGRFGSYLQWGDDGEDGTTTHSLPRSIGAMRTINTTAAADPDFSLTNLVGLTFEDAIKYVELPKTVSILHGEPIVASIGPYGPYLKYNSSYLTLNKKDGNVISIDEETAHLLVTERIINKPKGRQGVLAELGEMEGSKVAVKSGRFGMYINWKKVNAKLPAEFEEDPSELPLDLAWSLIEEKAPLMKDKAAKKKSATASGIDLPPAPKRPLSAYIQFCGVNRADVAKTKKTLGETSKELGRLWADLSDTDRKPYDELAATAKKNYEVLKAEWQKECQVELDKAKSKTAPLQRKMAKKKLENQPKRPKSAYLFFCADKRAEVSARFAKLGDISKEMGKMWSEISDDDKEPYIDLAVQDKLRYESEKAGNVKIEKNPSSPKKKATTKKKKPAAKKAGKQPPTKKRGTTA